MKRELLVIIILSIALLGGSFYIRTTLQQGAEEARLKVESLEKQKERIKKQLSDKKSLMLAARVAYTSDEKLLFLSQTLPDTEIKEGSSHYYVIQKELVSGMPFEIKIVMKIIKETLCPETLNTKKSCAFIQRLSPFEVAVITSSTK